MMRQNTRMRSVDLSTSDAKSHTHKKLSVLPDWRNCSCTGSGLAMGSGNVTGNYFVFFDVSIVISLGQKG